MSTLSRGLAASQIVITPTTSEVQLYGKVQVHLIESKVELVQKDPLKRKVSQKLINKFMRKFRGGIFQYKMSESVENIVEQVIEWKK